MELPYASLALVASGQDALFLVHATDAIRLSRQGDYRMLPAHRAVACLGQVGGRQMMLARDFVLRARLTRVPLSALTDLALLALLRTALKTRMLAVVQRGEVAVSDEPTVKLRRLVADIGRRTQRRLSHAGRSYKLVVDVDLGKTPSRDSYEVVRHDDAVKVLSAIGGLNQGDLELRQLLGKAQGELSRDWRPPLQPDGLVLLRRNIVLAAQSNWQPPLTPSQYAQLLNPKTWIEVEVVYDDDTPYQGPCVLTLADGSELESCLDEKGAFARYEIDPGNYAIAIPARAKPEEEDVEATDEETPPETRRVRLSGMLFDANKCFLLPQALPGIKTIIGMHEQEPGAEVLIVGHAGGDEDLAGADIAYERAQMLGAYLMNQPNAWLNWFGPDKPARSRWGTREVQLMLSALPEGGPPYYEGYASGVTDAQTTQAIRAFQRGAGLPADGKADFATRKALVEAYMGLEDTSLASDTTPVAHGCEGHCDDAPTASGEPPDDRRLEVFFFNDGIAPVPAEATSSADDGSYAGWLEHLLETRDFEHHGIHVQIVDAKQQPVPFATATLGGPTTAQATTDEHGYVSFFGLRPGEYTITSEKKGYVIGTSRLTYPTAKTLPGYAKDAA